MVDRTVTLYAGAEVAIEGALTLPPGYYRAVKRQIRVSTLTEQQFTDPEYLIELSGREIVAMGGTPGAVGLISAEVDVSRQVHEGLLRLSDRPPAPLARGAFAEYRPRDIFPAAAELQKQGVRKLAGCTWERVKSDLAERLRKTLREVKTAPLPFPGDLAMKLRPLQREKISADFIEPLRGVAVPNVVGKLFQFFSSPISGPFNVDAIKLLKAQHLRCFVFLGGTATSRSDASPDNEPFGSARIKMPPAARAQEHAAPGHFLALRLKWVERIIKAWREGCRVFYGVLHRFSGHRVIGPS
jgi:hypothetical protein